MLKNRTSLQIAPVVGRGEGETSGMDLGLGLDTWKPVTFFLEEIRLDYRIPRSREIVRSSRKNEKYVRSWWACYGQLSHKG